MGKKLVLLGGGHAHMVTLSNLRTFVEKGHEVTVVGPSEYHYYSGMGPGMLSGTYSPDEIRFATRHVVEKSGGKFVKDYVVRIAPEQKCLHLKSGGTLSYDVLSINAGSYVPDSCVIDDQGDVFYVKPIEKLIQARTRIVELVPKGEITIGIVGGGASAAEIAGNILQLSRDNQAQPPRIVILCGREFMMRFPEKVRSMVRSSLVRRGVDIREQHRVSEVRTGEITLESGQKLEADLVFMALGVRPSPIFEASGLKTGPDGGLLVNRYLQCPDHPELFGGGDCIYFADRPLDKVGVYAVRQNPVLYHNLWASLEGEPLKDFHPGGDYLLIFNLGESHGVLHKAWLTFGGRLAFRIKDYIDRRFMKRFQAIEH